MAGDAVWHLRVCWQGGKLTRQRKEQCPALQSLISAFDLLPLVIWGP